MTNNLESVTLRGRWKDHRTAKPYIDVIVLLLVLWSFALITGLPASVVRAALMVSLAEIALLLQRQRNIYNAIFASAFILLLWNPYYLMQVGFQLSYLAVLGIVYFHPWNFECLRPIQT